MKVKKLWRHAKFKKKTFTGRYEKRAKKNGKIDQSFYLLSNDGKETRLDFESPAMAESIGWVLS